MTTAEGVQVSVTDTSGTFWSMLDGVQRDVMRAVAEVRGWPAGAVIFGEGDRSRSVLVLTSGRVKIVAAAPGGHDAVLNVCGPGDIIGEIAAVDGIPRSAAVIALEAVTALWLSADRFTRILDQHPDLSVVLMKVITARLRRADVRRIEFGDRTTSARIAGLLVDFADRYGVAHADGVRIALRISQQDIAGLISASRESVARALRVLREEGVISTGRQRVIVHRMNELRRLRQ